jgi:hypothetical protein
VKFPITLPINELRLADTVQLFDGPFGTGTVTQIADSMVTIMRPYGTTADFSTTGGVIHYTGLETCKYWLDSSTQLLVYSRKELK